MQPRTTAAPSHRWVFLHLAAAPALLAFANGRWAVQLAAWLAPIFRAVAFVVGRWAVSSLTAVLDLGTPNLDAKDARAILTGIARSLGDEAARQLAVMRGRRCRAGRRGNGP
jgi:hypothetical protein